MRSSRKKRVKRLPRTCYESISLRRRQGWQVGQTLQLLIEGACSGLKIKALGGASATAQSPPSIGPPRHAPRQPTGLSGRHLPKPEHRPALAEDADPGVAPGRTRKVPDARAGGAAACIVPRSEHGTAPPRIRTPARVPAGQARRALRAATQSERRPSHPSGCRPPSLSSGQPLLLSPARSLVTSVSKSASNRSNDTNR